MARAYGLAQATSMLRQWHNELEINQRKKFDNDIDYRDMVMAGKIEERVPQPIQPILLQEVVSDAKEPRCANVIRLIMFIIIVNTSLTSTYFSGVE